MKKRVRAHEDKREGAWLSEQRNFLKQRRLIMISALLTVFFLQSPV